MTDTILDDDVLLLDRRENLREIDFLGVKFAPLNPQTLFDRIVEYSNSGRGFGYLVTPNVDHLVRLNANEALKPYYENAWLNVSDSRILEILAKLSGFALPACPGSDLTAQLFEKEIKPNEPVGIIGCDKEIIDIVSQKYGLQNIKWYDAPMGLKNKPDEVKKCAEFIKNNPARFHFICVGSPQQEMVALSTKELGGAHGIGLCVGASLDFLAGKIERAPLWMQKARLEWLHRLASEPKRMWKRYLVEGPKIFTIWLKWKNAKN